MKLIAVSSLAVRQFPAVVESLLGDLLAGADDRMIMLDFDTIKRRKDLHPSLDAPLEAHRMMLADWMKRGTDAYTVDEEAIRQSAFGLSKDRPVIVDASGYQLGTIVPVLRECRAAWFDLEGWHPAFVIQVSDVILPYATEELFDTFYSRPKQLTRTEVVRTVRGIRRQALLVCWFGFKPSRKKSRISRIWNWLDNATLRDEIKDGNQTNRWAQD